MNTKLRCLLLDDELPGLTYLRMLCQQIPDLEVVKSYNDPLKLIREIGELEFDLCILDIEMQGLNGLQVAHILSGKPVIFTTAYKQYAVEAFELDAIDYIEKPIRKERLEKAIRKAAIFIRSNKTERQFIQLNTNKGKTLLFFDQILHITTADIDKRDKLVLMETGDTLLLKNISFESLLSQLPSSLFCRINKKDVIALRVIRFFTNDEVMANISGADTDTTSFVLSEAYRKDFLQKLNG